MNPLVMAALIQGGSSLLGGLIGGGDEETRSPYTGSTTNPEATLATALKAIYSSGDTLGGIYGKGIDFSRASLPGVTPIQVPGLPFQIGGGFGMDPAMRSQGQGFQLPGMNLEPPTGGSGVSNPRPSSTTRRRRVEQ